MSIMCHLSTKYMLSLLVVGCHFVVSASESPSEPVTGFKPGWNGSAGIYVGVGDRQSLAVYHDDNRLIGSLDERAENHSDGIARLRISANFGYTADTQLFVATSQARLLAEGDELLFGIRRNLGDGTQLSAAVIPGLIENDAWLDPYLTAAERQDTSYKTTGLLLSANNIRGGPLSLFMDLGGQDYDDDSSGRAVGLSGEQQLLLGRDVSVQRLGASVAIPVHKGAAVVLDFSLGKVAADGAAQSFDGRGVGVGYYGRAGKINWMLAVDYRTDDYLGENPILGSVREDETLIYQLGAEYMAPFDMSSLSLHCHAISIENRSNQTFFDGDFSAVVVGAEYQF